MDVYEAKVPTKIDRTQKKTSLALHNHGEKEWKKRNTKRKMFASDFREVTCDFACLFSPFSPPSSWPEQKMPLVRILSKTIRWSILLDLSIIKKLFLISLQTKQQQQQQKQATKKIILKRIIFYDPRHTVESCARVSPVEIYNQANARNKSGVMYKSHFNARLQQDVLFVRQAFKLFPSFP